MGNLEYCSFVYNQDYLYIYAYEDSMSLLWDDKCLQIDGEPKLIEYCPRLNKLNRILE